MGFKKIPTIYTLEFDGEYEGLVVRMRSTSLGKVRKLLRLLDADEKDAPTLSVVDGIVGLLAESLVSWNMEDEDGQPIPADADALDDQDLPFLLLLSDKYLDFVTGPTPELGKDSAAGRQFPGAPLTMEAL